MFKTQFGSDYNSDLDLAFAHPDGTALRPNSHLLPHSHGSHLLAAGMELSAVAERLGHSSVMVTATIYSHRISGRDKQAALKWEEFQRSHETPERKQ